MFKSALLITVVLSLLLNLGLTARSRNSLRQKDSQSLQVNTAIDNITQKQQCLDSLSNIFYKESLSGDDPLSMFLAFIDTCTQQTLDIPNAAKAATCFYSGFFTVSYMLSKKDSPDNIETLKLDYCSKYSDILPKRTQFITDMRSVYITSQSNDFQSKCMNALQNGDGLNQWFSPIDPMVSISQKEICNLHLTLFDSLSEKGVTSLAEFIQFSYLSTLSLYLDASQQEDYESCINTQVIKSPGAHCDSFISGHQVFSLWNTTAQASACTNASTAIQTTCSQQCDACAIELAYLYHGYQSFINEQYADFFQRYEAKIFASLDQENRRQQNS